jgi:two-component system OmpR family sensor kinase
MMRRLAVRWRLTVAFALVMAVVLAAAGVFVYERQASNLNQTIDRALHARAADVAALAQQSDTGLTDTRQRRGGTSRAQLAELIDSSGHVLDRTPGLAPRPLLDPAAIMAARRGSTMITDVRLSGGEPVRLLAQSVHAQDQKLVIVVGQSLEERNLALNDLRGVLLVGGPAALLLASLAGYALTGAALRPVEAMRRRAASISAADLDQRLPPAGGNDELGRLGRTLNEMLARIRVSVDRERTFVSDASHELRTPLTMLRTELELIGRERPSGRELQAAIGSAVQETDRLSQLTDGLLLLARCDDHGLTITPRSLSSGEVFNQAADRARRHPYAAHKQVVVDPLEVDVLADPDRVAQALDNLVANALRHANKRIQLSARANGPFVELHVSDDGAGFPEEFLPRAWERFARADAARTEDGAGLGLAIVRAIAEAHGGQARAANTPTRGADVWITLPSGRAHSLDSSAAAVGHDEVGQYARKESSGEQVEAERVMSVATHTGPDLADHVQNRTAGQRVESQLERMGVNLVADECSQQRRAAPDQAREREPSP